MIPIHDDREPLQPATSMPPAFNNCACHCHRVPNVFHMAACCMPTPDIARHALRERIKKFHADADQLERELNEPDNGEVLP